MSGETVSAALLVEVQWGVVPGTAEGMKQWGFTREQVETATSWRDLLSEAYDEFDGRMSPAHNNWVTMTWLWL
jgi:hypothetical protein